MLCLDCTGQDLRHIAEWEIHVPMCSDFAISHREPRQGVFTFDGRELHITLWYSHCIRTVRVTRLVYLFHRGEVRGIPLPFQFLRHYLECSKRENQRLHVDTNRELGMFHFQGPYYGFHAMINAFYVKYEVTREDLINSPRMFVHVKKNSVVIDYEAEPERKQAWAEYGAASARLKEL